MDMVSKNQVKGAISAAAHSGLLLMVLMAGCAKHADFIELREDVTNLVKAQEQTQKRQEALQRRVETGKSAPSDESSKVHDASAQRIQDLTSRLSDLESRLARVEDGKGAISGKVDESRSSTSAASTRPSEPQESNTLPS